MLSKAIGIDSARITEVLKGNRHMSADLALRLGKFFKISPEFWLNIQKLFDSTNETSHLLSTQSNKKRLKDGIRELKEGNIVHTYKVPAIKTRPVDDKSKRVVKKSVK